MQVDLDPRKHSHQYEIKPMSRRWLVAALAFAGSMALASGIFIATTWAMFFAGAIVTTFTVLCFPKTFLTKDR